MTADRMSGNDSHDPGGHDHEPPDLAGLVAGELGRDETLATARHLRGCAGCMGELIDVIVAHGALRSSARVTRLLGGRSQGGTWAGGGPVPAGRALAGGTGGDVPADHAGLPPLRDAVRSEGSADGALAAGRRRRRMWRGATGAAAAILVVVGTTLGVVASRHGPAPAPVASAALRPLEAPASATGSVAVYASGSTRSLAVDARNLPGPGPQSFYEVWLLDPATQKMLPMGVLSPSGRGEYSVSSSIMGGYSVVDVSLQANNGDPAHSKTSVLRAYLQV
ncbi:MAG: anti-sigma factor [Actinomycetota bacterium]|nr:anti-sigma factor [Actinomycetota bacterium]